ncbi:UNVERIFIED_CONTAM: Pentatricopeptide repeat-containing protein [Sesamum angustifolium]|uniref:Pentatricopeptide repeat-containing protein n=1 Tax=Sesamum angustifolium TaxID=2727405 RepID=A0AAW2N6F4_9LAMI
MIERADEHRTDISSLTHRCKTLNQLKQIHGNLLKLPFRNFSALTSLLSFAVASADPAFFCYAEAIFRNLRRRTTFLYNTMIRGYVQSNKPIEAILCYKGMLNDRLIRNNYTFTPLVKACSMILPDFRLMGLLVHGHVVKLGFSLDPFIASALIEFYALNLDMHIREKVIFEKCCACIEQWKTWGLKPNEAVLVSALTACAHLGALAQGLWIHSYAEKCKYSSNPILATALVDMYSKCGCMNLALTVFDQIHDKDSRAWNAIISGLALNGDAMKSLELLEQHGS